jgi:hypothetical protein
MLLGHSVGVRQWVTGRGQVLLQHGAEQQPLVTWFHPKQHLLLLLLVRRPQHCCTRCCCGDGTRRGRPWGSGCSG